jgi:hypothetical protein
MAARKPAPTDSSGDTVVVSFRARRELVAQLDEIARGDQRTRANFIVRTLTHGLTLEPAIVTMEHILPRLVELAEKDSAGIQTQFYRGAMFGARSMLAAFFGKGAMRWVNGQVKKRTGLPMPTVNPPSEDGTLSTVDTEADVE